MIDSYSASISGMNAASRRLAASANNIANIDSRGTLPFSNVANAPTDQREPYLPTRVQSSSGPDGGTVTSERYLRPPYVPVFDTSAGSGNTDDAAGGSNVDVARERIEQIDAQQSFRANVLTAQSVQDVVRKLYDLN